MISTPLAPALPSAPSPLDARLVALVADHLGVAPGELGADVSLVDDLAADSLDLAELAVAIETHLGVAVPEERFRQVRTVGDLLAAVAAMATRPDADDQARAGLVRARVVRGGGAVATLERTLRLDPYAVDQLLDDARGAGRDGRLEIVLSAETAQSLLGWVRRRLGPLAARGVSIQVRRARNA